LPPRSRKTRHAPQTTKSGSACRFGIQDFVEN
jgi:hypothetical protein